MTAGGTPETTADVAVIGGSGLYQLLSGARQVTISTPFGPPSDRLLVGDVSGRRVAFLPRHGRDHRLAAHRINYRANLWALASLGVRQVLAASAVGSLRAEVAPGSFVVPDQVVDRTWGREQTFFDRDGHVGHAGFADPYCPRGRRTLLGATTTAGVDSHDGGTLVVVNGPRFSTRAESRWHAAQGWDVVGMTGMPEAVLARELGLCYAALTMVTDMDAGTGPGGGVSQEEVVAVFEAGTARARRLVLAAVAELPEPDGGCCPPAASLTGSAP